MPPFSPAGAKAIAVLMLGLIALWRSPHPPQCAHWAPSPRRRLLLAISENLSAAPGEKLPGPLIFAQGRGRCSGQKNFPIRRRNRAGERGVFHKCGKMGKNKAHGLDSRVRTWYNKMLLWPNRAKLPLLDRERSLTWQRENDKSKHRETNHLAGCAEKRSPTGIVQHHTRHGRFSLHPGENPDRTNRGSNRQRVDF